MNKTRIKPDAQIISLRVGVRLAARRLSLLALFSLLSLLSLFSLLALFGRKCFACGLWLAACGWSPVASRSLQSQFSVSVFSLSLRGGADRRLSLLALFSLLSLFWSKCTDVLAACSWKPVASLCFPSHSQWARGSQLVAGFQSQFARCTLLAARNSKFAA